MDNYLFPFIAVVIGLTLGGLIAFPFIKKSMQTASSSKKEINSGTIIQREINFYENVQTYILKSCSLDVLFDSIKKQNLEIDIRNDKENWFYIRN